MRELFLEISSVILIGCLGGVVCLKASAFKIKWGVWPWQIARLKRISRCQECEQEHPEFEQIEHTPDCLVTKLRQAADKAEGK